MSDPNNKNGLVKSLEEYKKTKPKVLEPFHQFGLGCPLRLRVNVYKGCAYQCRFCHVKNEKGEPRPYSRYISEYLEEDIGKAEKFGLNALPVMISCSTEPFQPLEDKYGHTKEVLRLLAEEGFSLIIMTQNPSKLLNNEYLKIIKSTHSVVEVTIPSLTKEGIFETGAPHPEERFNCLPELVKQNIPVRLRLDPIIPNVNGKGLVQSEEEIKKIIERFAEIFNQANSETKKDMMVLVNVMTLNNDVLSNLAKVEPPITQEYQDFYRKNGYEYEREDTKRMFVLNPEIQKQLLLPIFDACREKEVPLCPCVLDVHFYGTRNCDFPIKYIPLSLDSDVTGEDIIEKIKNKFPAHPVTEYEKRSFWVVKRFLVEDFEFITFLSEKIFNSDQFKQAIKERKLKEFFTDKNFIKDVLSKLLEIDASKLDFSYSYPVLYWAFAPLIRMLNACSYDKNKPDVIWGSINFWDTLIESHYGTQFLHPDYFKPGDKFLFNKIINEWLLQPNNPHILTITKLFLIHKSNRKIIVIQKLSEGEEPRNYKKLYQNKILCRIRLSDNYTKILGKLKDKKPRYKIKNEISQGGDVNKIMKEYVEFDEKISPDFSELVKKLNDDLKNSPDLQIKIDEEETKKFLRLLFVFDLVSPEEWKWIVIYPSLLYTGEPVGGVFLLLHRLLDVPAYRLLQHMVTEIFTFPQILIDKHKFLEKSLRSAVAAIMARNMSHLLGSHIEPGIQNDMPSFLLEVLSSSLLSK